MLLNNRFRGQDKLGSAVRYENPMSSGWFNRYVGKKIYIEPQPLSYLQSLNGYDQHQICKGIEELASVSSPMDGFVNKQNPAFYKAKEATSTIFNFFIKYTMMSESIVVSSIALDSVALAGKPGGVGEQQSLHLIEKNKGGRAFSPISSLDDIDSLVTSWNRLGPVTKVKSKHAAVNGMLNDLEKATWLMGVHTEAAFSKEQVEKYTLFHNPTESPRSDFFESIKDNLGFTTPLAEHLAAILLDIQLTGEPVKWVVHSQGGIIFKQAVKHHLKQFPGQSLSKNSVVFHSGGHNKTETDKLLSQARVKKEAADKDNPFDLVPNLAGRNDLSAASIKRSVGFWNKVKGTNTSSPVESPHTLPFLSLEAYHGFLVMAGDNRSAEKVQKYMDKLTTK